MKIKLSILEIEQMNLLSSFVHFTPGTKSQLTDFFLTNEIDIDFNIFDHKENKFQFKVLLIIKINDDIQKKKTGYSIVTSMEGVFRVLDSNDDNEYLNFKLRSALPMLISNLRTHIYDITSKFPAGGYLLPSIDLLDLINQKKEAKSFKKLGATKRK
jgi:preprotein translocase subunit SecB